ncbi:MAG: L,D-transpeptidase family protein, partial [Planctomycetaceae bacterium]|nr:L,D-transpeptidase family protein [Planctomycetaceae bacterium]
AWHLELLPMGEMNSAQVDLDADPMEEFLSQFPENEPTPVENEPREPEMAQTSAIDNVPAQPVEEPEATPADIWTANASQEQPEIHSTSVDLTSRMPQAEPMIEQVGHQVETGNAIYRPTEQPVSIQTLPFRGSEPPVQYANQSVAMPEQTFVQTAAVEQVVEPAANSMQEPQPLNMTEEAQPMNSPAEQTVLRLRELSARYWKDRAGRQEFEPELLQLAHQVFFRNEQHFLPAHVVEPNQHLETIARQYDVPWQYLANLNRITPEQLRAGQELKVIQGPFDAVVELSEFRLTLHANGYVVAIFPIGIGQNSTTPLGQFQVLNKLENPTYYGPDEVISCDDPNNPLGEHWIDLGNSIGIHGTNEPETIGQAKSRGCIRMRNEDAAAVYDLLTQKSRISIRG